MKLRATNEDGQYAIKLQPGESLVVSIGDRTYELHYIDNGEKDSSGQPLGRALVSRQAVFMNHSGRTFHEYYALDSGRCA